MAGGRQRVRVLERNGGDKASSLTCPKHHLHIKATSVASNRGDGGMRPGSGVCLANIDAFDNLKDKV